MNTDKSPSVAQSGNKQREMEQNTNLVTQRSQKDYNVELRMNKNLHLDAQQPDTLMKKTFIKVP